MIGLSLFGHHCLRGNLHQLLIYEYVVYDLNEGGYVFDAFLCLSVFLISQKLMQVSL